MSTLVEPEVVWHTLCPKAEMADVGDGVVSVTHPSMRLTQTLDDAAGRQRRYQCPRCGMEVTVNFPPKEPPWF